jgi:hypothetical protein
MKHELDFSIEIVILLVLAVFMLLFGFVLFLIQSGVLPYSPDSTYGLFLVIVSFQIITMGKTPFGDYRRSWLLVVIGMCTSTIGMAACCSWLADRVCPRFGRVDPVSRWLEPSRAALCL